jgi:hypothetical protein
VEEEEEGDDVHVVLVGGLKVTVLVLFSESEPQKTAGEAGCDVELNPTMKSEFDHELLEILYFTL